MFFFFVCEMTQKKTIKYMQMNYMDGNVNIHTSSIKKYTYWQQITEYNDDIWILNIYTNKKWYSFAKLLL